MTRNLVNQKNVENIMLSAIEDRLSVLINRIYQVIEAQAKDGLNNTLIYWCDFKGYEDFDWHRIRIYFEKQGFTINRNDQSFTIIW